MQRVVMPTTEAESWTVLDGELEPVAPAEQYLAYLSAIERSPTTVRAYAHSLKLWFEFLSLRDLAWNDVGIDAVAQFVVANAAHCLDSFDGLRGRAIDVEGQRPAIGGRIGHAALLGGLSCRPTRTRSVSDRSPTIMRTGCGSFRTTVGTARI